MKRWTKIVTLVLAVALASAVLASASGENTLVSLSYLNGTYASQLASTLKNMTGDLQSAYDAALEKLNQKNGQAADVSGNWTSTTAFETVYPEAGETVTLSAGSGLVWYSGSGSASAVLVDVTAGTELSAGNALTAGHRYLAEQEAVVTASVSSSCGAEGLWRTTATGSAPVQLPFTDVPAGAYYYDAVAWAVEHGITNGTSETTFSPFVTCNRAQTVTFLWRAAGKPVPESSVNPFTDVAPGTDYYDAILWAVEEGITNGTSATTFSPNAPVTRAQAVTFLWRAAGKPSPTSSKNPFTDVASGSDYYSAILWAVEKEITNGTSATTFSPNDAVPRAQAVTFLYRSEAA